MKDDELQQSLVVFDVNEFEDHVIESENHLFGVVSLLGVAGARLYSRDGFGDWP